MRGDAAESVLFHSCRPILSTLLWEPGAYMARISFRIVDGVLVVRFAVGNRIDVSDVQSTGTELQQLFDSIVPGELKGVVVNFEGIEFMNSAMIGKLVLFNKKCRHHHLQVKVCNVSPKVRDVFRITGLNRAFEIDPNPFDDLPDPDDEGPGTAGSTANLKPRPGSGGGHASPPPSHDS